MYSVLYGMSSGKANHLLLQKKEAIMTRALVFLAEGAEEMETVIVVDTMRRAGWDVTLAGLGTGIIQASRGVRIAPDADILTLEAVDYDVLAIPGGMGGVNNLMGSPKALEMVREFNRTDKLIGAICAGPLVLQAAGILNEKTYTCYPGVEKEISVGRYVNEPVVVDGRLITSQGPGTAMVFALTLIEHADGPDARQKVAGGLVMPHM